jgi:hypothetical protein
MVDFLALKNYLISMLIAPAFRVMNWLLNAWATTDPIKYLPP